MNLKSSFRLVLLTAVASLVLSAQVGRQRDPLPLNWQPAQIPAPGQAVVATPADATVSPTAPLVFVAMLPCRVVDTRTGDGFTGDFGPPSLISGASRTFPILSSTTCTIPTEAQAYSFDITVVPPGPLAYVTAYPTGQPTPVAAVAVESPQGTLASNVGIIPAGSNGSIDVYASNPTDLVVDINGYYVSLAFALPMILAEDEKTRNPNNQTSFFAGIRGVTTGNNDAIPVAIDSNGQLGTVSSSRRFKEDIHDMDTVSSGLMRLRPVTFRYQKPFGDGSRPIQYGLIAEEAADVYPDLVAHSADGQIETVKYQVLDSMLLNELQKEHKQVQEQAETIRELEARLAVLEKALLSGR
jgi:Chaperone of endosialidase